MAIPVTLYCQKENKQKLDSMISSREALIFSRKTLILCVCVCICICVCVYVHTQSLSHPILCNPTDNSPPSSFVLGISQARILEWVDLSFSRGSSQPRNLTQVSCVSCIGRCILYHCVTWEAIYIYMI